MGAGCQESGDQATAVTPEKGSRVANRAANRNSRKVVAVVAADGDVGGVQVAVPGTSDGMRQWPDAAGQQQLTARGGSVTA